MQDRFENLKKVPAQPALRLLANANAKLRSTVSTPASAPVSAVMADLAAQGAFVDMLRLMSVALPPREGVWWACLAARDVIGPVDKLPLPLELAERWVRKPSDETREAARTAIDLADIDDETVLCATAVLYYDGKLGTGELSQYDGPPGATAAACFAMNIAALDRGQGIEETADVLVDRAVDIARGGNGTIALPPLVAMPESQEEEEDVTE